MNHRQILLHSLRNKIEQKRFLIAAGVGNLNQVKCCQNQDCDLILLYPVSKYSSASNPFLAGYLAFGNTNDQMLQMASELMPIINSKNVLAGLNGSDPFKICPHLLKNMHQHHFAGIHNYPAMSLVDGTFGMNINSLSLGVDKEITMFKAAIKEELFTCAMVQTKKQLHDMMRIGVDMIIFYIGLGEGNSISRDKQRRQHIHQLNELTKAAHDINPHTPLLFFDESITTIDEIPFIIKEVSYINGYCLLPVTKADYPEHRLALEISQLQKLSR